MPSRYPPPLPPAALAARWREAWAALPRSSAGNATARDGEPLCATLLAAWSEPRRHYHDRRHLGECLAHLQRWRAAAARPAEAAVALWFHDAVYRPLSRDNEAASADDEADVRREYRAVPMFLYRRGRRRVLQQFAGCEALYRTAAARAACEAAAHCNVAAALARLGGRAPLRALGGAR